MRAFLLGCLFVIGAIWGALADPVLKPQVSVQRDMIQLGDLFDDLPASADRAAEVARAPGPGQRHTLDANTLANIATAHRIGWKPSGRFDRVVVERVGQVVTAVQIREAIAQALHERGLPGNADVALDNERLQITVPANKSATVRAEGLVYDPARPRFEAVLVAPADDPRAERVKVQGKIFRTVEVPVLTRPFAVGEVIRARDIEMVRLRTDQVGPTHVNDPDKLLDKSAKRVLPAFQPIRVGDVTNPILVQRNSIVQVRIASQRLAITMQGKAMEDGAEGDSVRVLNTRSNKIVQGVVNSRGEVVVTTAYSVVSN